MRNETQTYDLMCGRTRKKVPAVLIRLVARHAYHKLLEGMHAIPKSKFRPESEVNIRQTMMSDR